MLRGLLVVGLAAITACGSSSRAMINPPAAAGSGSVAASSESNEPARANEPANRPAASTAPAAGTSPPLPAAPASADRIDAPPTPARSYDAAACAARVKLFDQRVKAAYDFASARASYLRSRDPVSATPDAGLGPAPVTVWIRPGGYQPVTNLCSPWGVTIVGGGRDLAIDGKQRIARTLAAVKQRLPKRGRIALQITAYTVLSDTGPLLPELGKLGPLQLSVAVEGARYVLPTQDVPAWALERIRAMEATESSSQKAISAGIVASSSSCRAIGLAAKAVLDETFGDKGWVMWQEYTKAVKTCQCTGIDVDALEAFTSLALAYDSRLLADGWIELRIDPTSATVVTAPNVSALAKGLAALSREQRMAGLRLVFPPDPASISTFEERCKDL